MTTIAVVSAVTEVEAVAGIILSTVEQFDPAVALPASEADAILNIVAEMVTKALNAYSAASGVPITPESIAALLPDPTPLTPPTE